MSCAEAAWEKVPTMFTPCIALLILLDLSAWFSLAAAPAVRYVFLPTACPLHRWLVHLFPLPVLRRGTGPWLCWRQICSSASLTFHFSSKYPLLKKILGKKRLTRQQRGFQLNTYASRSPEGWRKSKPIRGKKGKLHNMFFFSFLDPCCEMGTSHSTFCLEGKRRKRKRFGRCWQAIKYKQVHFLT